jgi:hypothetical protein
VWVPRSGGGDRGYLIANADLIHAMPGDLTNLRVNSHLDCYRMNPNGYEKPIQSLPMQFKNTLATIKGFSEKHSPVWVAWDPVELDQPEEQVREALKYKDQWEITNQQLDHLTKQLRSTNTISAQLASTAMASGELGMQNIRERGKKPLLRTRNEEEDEDR